MIGLLPYLEQLERVEVRAHELADEDVHALLRVMLQLRGLDCRVVCKKVSADEALVSALAAAAPASLGIEVI